jgi:L-rhamnose mutarotase
MIKKAIRMKVHPDQHKEYERRHKELWPEMRLMLKEHGCTSYSIWLDKENSTLFGYLEIEDEAKWEEAATTEVNRKWWDFMADVMETNSDHSPVTVELHQEFDL